jgi:hypothetical protein
MVGRIFLALFLLTAMSGTNAFSAQLDPMTVPVCRPIAAEPVDRDPSWPANGYRAEIVMLDNAGDQDTHYAIARLPADAAVTKGFITFMVAAKTALGYTTAVPLKITLH